MVKVVFTEKFKDKFSKIDNSLKEKVAKQIYKIKDNPKIGKPMKFSRKGTREVYVSPFRFSYLYISEEDTIWLLEIYHKDEQ